MLKSGKKDLKLNYTVHQKEMSLGNNCLEVRTSLKYIFNN